MFRYSIYNFINKNRILIGFIITTISLTGFDIVSNLLFNRFSTEQFKIAAFDIGFAPEIWLTILTLVLGTLIIVISIASQNTPRLIDLYLNNWTSILYMWFITLSSIHSVIFLLIESLLNRPASGLLNSFLLLPIALLSSLPYIFFILNYSKMDHVIGVINNQLSNAILKVEMYSKSRLIENQQVVRNSHFIILEKTNQLMDLFSYVDFKETKGAIIKHLSTTLEKYITLKSKYNTNYFVLTEEIKQDISFSNYTQYQFLKMEKRQTFFEEKIFRIMGNIYNESLTNKNHELASDCCSKIVHIGKIALQKDDDILVGLVSTRINTLFRLSINDGVKNGSSRIINNFIFQSGKLLDIIIKLKKEKELLRYYEFLLIYGNKLFTHSIDDPNIGFSVSFLLYEEKRSLIKINEEGWDDSIQEKLIQLMLKIDEPSDIEPESLLRHKIKHHNSRIILLALALYYCSEKKFDLAKIIIDNSIKELGDTSKEMKMKIFKETFEKLEQTRMSFWEDTDRGTFNIYFSHETDLIDPLLKFIEERL